MGTTDGITIRRAQPDDGLAVHRVFCSAIRAIAEEFYDDTQKKAWEEAVGADSWATRILELSFFVACEDDEIVGFVSWFGNEIEHIYVDSRHDHKGVGKQLMQFALEKIPIEEVTLTASLNAIRFYESFGFTKTESLVKHGAGVPIPCIRMTRDSV